MNNNGKLIKICCVIIIIVLAIFYFISIKNKGEIQNLKDDTQKSYSEIAETLRNLGISGIKDELIEKLEEQDKQRPTDIILDKTATILTEVGSGEYNYETFDWTPTNKTVYSFDMEVFNIEEMYTSFFRGISFIGDGEIEFTNVKEDLSREDIEAGTGTRIITFDLNGNTYTLEAENNNDWFDINIVKEINKIIMEQGKTKRLYITGDGYQECIVFYCDDNWAKSFQKNTGITLSNT